MLKQFRFVLSSYQCYHDCIIIIPQTHTGHASKEQAKRNSERREEEQHGRHSDDLWLGTFVRTHLHDFSGPLGHQLLKANIRNVGPMKKDSMFLGVASRQLIILVVFELVGRAMGAVVERSGEDHCLR